MSRFFQKMILFGKIGAALLLGALLGLSAGCALKVEPIAPEDEGAPGYVAESSHLDPVMTLAEQRHLLERTGLGVPLKSLEQLQGKTRREGIRLVMDGLKTAPWNPPPPWVKQVAPAYWSRGDMEEPQRQRFNMARDREMAEFRLWWVREMIETPSPQTERLVLFWHNHFVSTYPALNEQSTALARQNLMLRREGSGNFRTLLKAVIRDAAMLNYLDNDNNNREHPNENLARELLELFTLGEGSYDESSVKEAARALTGYGTNELRDLSFEIRPWDQDRGVKNILGSWGFYDGDDLIDLILEQPQAGEFMARKFWRHYVSEFQEDQAEIQRISHLFRESDYDLKTLLQATLATPTFWSPKSRGSIIKAPVDLIIGTIRTTGIVPTSWQSIPSQLAILNQDLFGQPNVAGWPGGSAWVSPANLLNRHFLLTNLSTGTSVQMNYDTDDLDDLDEERRLEVRLASEDYQGAPRFTVKAVGENNEVLWSSEPRVVQGGYDTELNGRVSNTGQLSWYSEVFEFDPPAKEVRSLRVHFLNDAAGPNGDRNLFVDWVRQGRKVFPASEGRQLSGCPPKNPAEAGKLYCSGYVEVSEALTLEEPAEPSPPPPDTLQVEAVHLRWGNDPDRGGGDVSMSLGLKHVWLNERYWEALAPDLVISPREGYLLKLHSSNCQPQCFSAWPSSAWRNDQDPKRMTLAFPLNHVPHLENHWRQLGEEDRLLVGLLWRALPRMIEQIRTGRRFREEPHLKNWEPHFEQMIARLEGSKYVRYGSATPLVIRPAPKQQGMMMSMMMGAASNQPPLPNGQPPLKGFMEYEAALKQLLPDARLGEVMLALPLELEPEQEHSYLEVVEHPIYQLR